MIHLFSLFKQRTYLHSFKIFTFQFSVQREKRLQSIWLHYAHVNFPFQPICISIHDIESHRNSIKICLFAHWWKQLLPQYCQFKSSIRIFVKLNQNCFVFISPNIDIKIQLNICNDSELIFLINIVSVEMMTIKWHTNRIFCQCGIHCC